MLQTTIAVVNYNTRDRLRECLASIIADGPNHVIVVDNSSSDGSAEMVRAEFADVELIANRYNSGYGAALNRALEHVTSQYTIALNGDTVLSLGSVRALETYLNAHPNAVIVGPRLRNGDGSLQRSCRQFPGTLPWLLDNRLLAPVFCRIPLLKSRFLSTWAHDDRRIVPFVTGAAFAMRTDAVRSLGGFDESFFMYYEETDLCYRLSLKGWEIHFSPVTDVIHYACESTNQSPEVMAGEFIVSTIRFYRRHYQGVQLLMALASIKVLLSCRWLRDYVVSVTSRSRQRRCRAAGFVGVWRRFLLH